MVEKVEKKGRKLGGDVPKLTSAEREVLHLLTSEFLTIKQVAIRRKTSDKYIYKILKKLKEKGVIDKHKKKVEKNQCGFQPSTTKKKKIRLHGQEFNIKILYSDHRYLAIKNKSNLIYIDNNTIRLYKDSIEVYSNHDFWGSSVDSATIESLNYFQKIFRTLESDLKIILIKSRKQNIRLVKHHYAEINNELAKECNDKAQRVNIHAKEDGKIWFSIDNSFNLAEAETQHKETAAEDMQEVVQPFFNDLRDNRPPTLSEVMKVIKSIAEQNKETSAGLNAVVNLFKLQNPTVSTDDKEKNIKLSSYIG